MTCSICKNGKMHSGKTTVILNRPAITVIIKAVPAKICDNCGEYWLESLIAAKVYKLADEAEKNGSEVEIRKFTAA
jgi:YgiT-type zinc finger domain-containing protein